VLDVFKVSEVVNAALESCATVMPVGAATAAHDEITSLKFRVVALEIRAQYRSSAAPSIVITFPRLIRWQHCNTIPSALDRPAPP
jgi:hypothetical protein